MGRHASAFKQRDVTRAIRACTAAGMKVAQVQIGADKKIILIADDPSKAPEPVNSGNEWDAV